MSKRPRNKHAEQEKQRKDNAPQVVGEVWRIPNNLIMWENGPDQTKDGDTLRPILLLRDPSLSKSPVLLAAPFSTTPIGDAFDHILEHSEQPNLMLPRYRNGLPARSRIALSFIQPVRRIDLFEYKGHIEEQDFREISIGIVSVTGAIFPYLQDPAF